MFDRVLVAVRRHPTRATSGWQRTGVETDEPGFREGRLSPAHRGSTHPCHRRCRRRAHAGPQGLAGSQVAAEILAGKAADHSNRRHARGRLHRSGACLVRSDGDRGHGPEHRAQSRPISLGRFRSSVTLARPDGLTKLFWIPKANASSAWVSSVGRG